MRTLASYAQGQWVAGAGKAATLLHAVTGEPVAQASSEGLDFRTMLEYGRRVGGPVLRKMTFHERARMIKALAAYLMERKEEFYEVSKATGATRNDSWVDIEGGFGTLFTFASKGRRELPDETFYIDGDLEPLSKGGTFVGRHIAVPLEGVAVHINAYNFPVWGMLEKLAPTFLGGMPSIVKPATATSFLTESVVRAIIESKILPEGALQLIVGGVGDLFEYLTLQDVVTFTGSAATGRKLRAHPKIIEESIRFNMEADSLNFCMLGPDDAPGTPEFDLFIKEVAREMTLKSGQRCTAIRRTFVPEPLVGAVIEALSKRLGGATLGDPSVDGVRMGPLATRGQVAEVRKNVELLKSAATIAYGSLDDFTVKGADKDKGAFFAPVLLHCADPLGSEYVHDVEAFGPVNTVMGYRNVDEAIELTKRGKGSLVGSLFTADNRVAREIVLGTAAYHGRLLVINRHSAGESTGHGSPMPHLIHGGPGRAGGGEEMGGIRGVMHYLQRTAIQGSPETLTRITNLWMKGADTPTDVAHPFSKYFDDIKIGDTLFTHRRTVTEADVVNFAGISGDYFYAHTDEIAAKESPLFGRRVAHGYFVLSAAAGLFVYPPKGPVLANYGLERLRFTKPVYPGDTIAVRFTAKQKTLKETPADGVPQGVVEWDVEVTNQEGEICAVYSILTLVERRPAA
ncbi:MAG: phenylacetic acid degradation bifunctional protein PaaZ [Gemmatimonadales bacterium]|nr:phenylacetic acid degradation bifunctional protein PaaZ [Gemmatimonadales bacterium]